MPEESAEVDKVHGADKLLGGRFVFPEVYGDDLAGNRMDVDMVASSSFEVPFPIHPYGENRRVVFGKNIIVGVPSLNSSWRSSKRNPMIPNHLCIYQFLVPVRLLFLRIWIQRKIDILS